MLLLFLQITHKMWKEQVELFDSVFFHRVVVVWVCLCDGGFLVCFFWWCIFFFPQVLKCLHHLLETSVPLCMGASADSPSAGLLHCLFCFPLEWIFQLSFFYVVKTCYSRLCSLTTHSMLKCKPIATQPVWHMLSQLLKSCPASLLALRILLNKSIYFSKFPMGKSR